MTTERRREMWNHTCYVAAAVINSQVGRKRPVLPSRLHPLYKASQKSTPAVEGDISCLMVFLPKKERQRLLKERRDAKRRRN